MPNNHLITKDYQFLRGFSTDSMFVRPPNVSSIAKNINRNADTTFGPRRGYQCKAASIGGLGTSTLELGAGLDPEIITISRDGNLYRMLPGSLQVGYSGSSFITISLFVDPRYSEEFDGWSYDPWSEIPWGDPSGQTFTFQLFVNNVLTLDVLLGTGYDSKIPSLTIQDLIDIIITVPNVTAAYSGDISTPAAFLDLVEPTNITFNTLYRIPFFYWEAVNRTVVSTFPGSVAAMNSPNFEDATFAPYNGVTFISNGYDYPQKFDGQTVYRAGMPQGATPSVMDSGIAGNPNGSYQYFVTYEQIDAKGNIVEGVISASAVITVTTNKVNVTVTNLLEDSGWNTNAAQVGGSPVTSTVTGTGPYLHTLAIADATLKAGDRAFYFDTNSGQYQTDLVSSVTPTNFTIIRSTNTVVILAAASPISNNLKINIWRTVTTGTQPFLLATIPNNPFAATQVYVDNTADANLGEPYSDPVRLPNPPPIARYILAFGNQVIYSGDPANDDYVWFSEPERPEYVPTAFNFFIVPPNDDDITALGSAGTTLIVGKESSIFSVMGDLVGGSFTVKAVAPGSNIGMSSQATVKPVGSTLYFLDDNGVYSITESQIFPTDPLGNPVPLSQAIDVIFRQVKFINNEQYVVKRATAFNYSKDQQYWLFIPCEDTPSVTQRDANANSRVFCYDYQGKNWFEWDNINAAGGFVGIGDDLWFHERRFSRIVGATANIYRQHRRYRNIDFADHAAPIHVNWQSSWEDLGQPRTRKKFVRVILLLDRDSNLYQFNDPLMDFTTAVDWLDLPYTQAEIVAHDNDMFWGQSRWGWGIWGGYRDSFVTIPLRQGGVAKAVSIGFTMARLNTTFRFQGFQIEVAPAFNQTILR